MSNDSASATWCTQHFVRSMRCVTTASALCVCLGQDPVCVPASSAASQVLCAELIPTLPDFTKMPLGEIVSSRWTWLLVTDLLIVIFVVYYAFAFLARTCEFCWNTIRCRTTLQHRCVRVWHHSPLLLCCHHWPRGNTLPRPILMRSVAPCMSCELH